MCKCDWQSEPKKTEIWVLYSVASWKGASTAVLATAGCPSPAATPYFWDCLLWRTPYLKNIQISSLQSEKNKENSLVLNRAILLTIDWGALKEGCKTCHWQRCWAEVHHRCHPVLTWSRLRKTSLTCEALRKETNGEGGSPLPEYDCAPPTLLHSSWNEDSWREMNEAQRAPSSLPSHFRLFIHLRCCMMGRLTWEGKGLAGTCVWVNGSLQVVQQCQLYTHLWKN